MRQFEGDLTSECTVVRGLWSVVRGLWSVVRRPSYVDNLVENLLETTTAKIWKRLTVKCIFNSQD